jgi:hypothetical protein
MCVDPQLARHVEDVNLRRIDGDPKTVAVAHAAPRCLDDRQ